MEYVDVCIGNEEDAQKCLGFTPDSDVEHGSTDAAGYHTIFEQMAKKFGFSIVASTLRESHSASDNGWKALLYDGSRFYESRHYEIVPIVDRVGGGDGDLEAAAGCDAPLELADRERQDDRSTD